MIFRLNLLILNLLFTNVGVHIVYCSFSTEYISRSDQYTHCNFRAAEFYTGAFYGEGRGPVFIDQLFCEKHDYDLSNCKYLFLNECTHERDVSVVCNGMYIIKSVSVNKTKTYIYILFLLS